MLLEQPDVEKFLEHGAEGHPGVTEQSGRELGVEQPPGQQTHLVQAVQVLAGGVDDPLRIGDRRRERTEVGRTRAAGWFGGRPEGDGVDQVGAGAAAAELDQVGPLAVAEAVGPFGVHGDRSRSGLQADDRRLQLRGGARSPGERRQPAGSVGPLRVS